MKFSSKVYDFLRDLAQVILPAAGALYFAVAGIWALPAADKVVGTITAVDAFLGLILKASSSSYQQTGDGKIVIDRSDDAKDVYRLEGLDMQAIDNQDQVILKVESNNKSAMVS